MMPPSPRLPWSLGITVLIAALSPGLSARRAWAAGDEAAPRRPAARARPQLPTKDRIELTRKLASAYSAEGKHRQAAAEYRTLVKLDPSDVDARLGLADELKYAGELGAAEEAYNETLRLDPKRTSAKLGLGQCRFWRGDSVAAARTLTAARATAPDDAAVRLELARVYTARGSYQEARTLLADLPLPRSKADQQRLDDAEALKEHIELRVAPWIAPDASFYSNNFEFRRWQFGLEGEAILDGDLTLGAGFWHGELRQLGRRVARETVLGRLAWRPRYNLRLGVGASFHQYESRSSTVAWFLSLAFEPLDRVQVLASVERYDLVDGAGGQDHGEGRDRALSSGGATIAAVLNRVGATRVELGADQAWFRWWSTYLRLAYTDVDQSDNRALEISLGAGIEVWSVVADALALESSSQRSLQVKYGFYRVAYDQKNPDYFSPDAFGVHTLSLELQLGWIDPQTLLGVRVVLEPGLQILTQEAERGVFFHGSIEWRASRSLGLRGQVWYHDQTIPFRSTAISGALVLHF